jgi:hypothetical protein
MFIAYFILKIGLPDDFLSDVSKVYPIPPETAPKRRVPVYT